MNILGCAHQYCDECMAKMPGADGPFRDALRWYYNCYLCNKRTSEAKLIRTDPYGRRLVCVSNYLLHLVKVFLISGINMKKKTQILRNDKT